MSLDLYFGGAEQRVWRDLLYANGVRHMSLSFMGLRRRVRRLDRWRLEEQFPGDVEIYLDSGAFTLNKPDSPVTASEAASIRDDYLAFVRANIHRLAFAAEFDASVLGEDDIFQTREQFWSPLPSDRWMPVWHADYGTNRLLAMGDSYARVGVLQDDAGGDLSLTLNRLAGQTRLHGISMTRQEAMEQVRWSSVGSTRWLAPAQYGDTFVWTNAGELKDYPKKYKQEGRRRHRTWLHENEFDTELIEADDRNELLRLSVWSWRKYVEHLNGVTGPPDSAPPGNRERATTGVGIPGDDMGNETVTTASAALERAEGHRLLPVVGFDFENVRRLGDDGQSEEVPESRMTTPARSLMRCDSCFIRSKCPAMQPGAECAYEIPAQIRTPAQALAVRQAVAEMQTQRVLRMVMIEQMEGGYADPNLTAEIGRLWKMLSDLGVNPDTVKLTLEASGQQASAGTISRLFGEQIGQRLHQLEAPRDAQSVIAEVVDAEVVSEH